MHVVHTGLRTVIPSVYFGRCRVRVRGLDADHNDAPTLKKNARQHVTAGTPHRTQGRGDETDVPRQCRQVKVNSCAHTHST